MNHTTPAPEIETARVPEPVTGEPRRVIIGEVGLGRTFSALRYRNFRLFFFGQLMSLVGTWMQNTAQGWLIYQLTGSKFLLGLVAAAGSAPLVFFSIWGGWLADHYPKRSVLVVTQSIAMMLAFVLTAVVWVGVVQPWHIMVISLLGGVVLAFDMPSRQSFIVEMTSRDDLMNAISLNSSIVNGARIIGPAVAGAVMAKAGMTFCFFLNGVSFLAVIAGLLTMRLPAHVRPVNAETAWQQALSGFGYVRGNFRVHVLMSLFAVVGSNTLIQTSVPDEMRGRVMGIWALIFGGMIPLGSLEAGAVAHVVDIPLTLATGAVLCAIAAAVTLTVVLRRRASEKI